MKKCWGGSYLHEFLIPLYQTVRQRGISKIGEEQMKVKSVWKK
jgi:hypothetical protein